MPAVSIWRIRSEYGSWLVTMGIWGGEGEAMGGARGVAQRPAGGLAAHWGCAAHLVRHGVAKVPRAKVGDANHLDLALAFQLLQRL